MVLFCQTVYSNGLSSINEAIYEAKAKKNEVK
jgi:hypothetical protein